MNISRQAVLPRCSRGICKRRSEVELEGRILCRKHFIETSYARLDQIAEQLRQRELRGSVSDLGRSFLAECTSKVASEAFVGRKLNNLDRSRLLDILSFASSLTDRLRRSTRVSRLVPVRLINTAQKATWIEDTVTQNLSKHGAMLRCTHAYGMGERVGLVRLDTGEKAIARVVWRARAKFAQHKVAVEILNCANFWNLQGDTRGSL